MIIRLGTYTLYENIEMTLIEYYGHGLDQEIEQYHRIISYPQDYGLIEGFSFDSTSKRFKKDILIDDLDNAFFVLTKAIYQGEEFEVEPYYGDEIHLHLATKDLELGKKLNFYELHDGHGKPYYLGEIKKTEIEKIWEERKPSDYKIPMSNGLELIKEIDIS